ncbi:GntR family transcriptional regulator [Lentisphaera araneosa]|nr:GntR family transcriptional regulator [Lentisphaera araneosa]
MMSKDNKLARGRGKKTFLYKQFAEIIRKEIEDGKYKPGERLPSMDDLSVRYNLNKITVRRSLQELADAGLLYSVPAQGTFVSEFSGSSKAVEQSESGIMNIGLISNVLIPGSTGPYHMSVLEGIRSEIGRHDANFILLPAPGSRERKEILKMIHGANLSGVIYMGPVPQLFLEQLIKDGPPSIVVDYHFHGLRADVVQADNREGGFVALNALIENGCKKLAVIAGDKEQSTTDERLDGVWSAAKAHNIPLESIRVEYSDYQINGGYEAMERLASDMPDGVFCMNDEMAFGASRLLKEKLGDNFIEKVSLVGFDDINWAALVNPALSTVSIDKEAMGRIIAKRLFERIEKPEIPRCVTLMPPSFISRETL